MKCRYPECVENEDERCIDLITGDCKGMESDKESREIEFNINETVKVRLTEIGHQELKRQHVELMDSLNLNREYHPKKEDADGWSEWQLWDLMSRLGHMAQLGFDPPFGTIIRILITRTTVSDS